MDQSQVKTCLRNRQHIKFKLVDEGIHHFLGEAARLAFVACEHLDRHLLCLIQNCIDVDFMQGASIDAKEFKISKTVCAVH